MPWGSSPREAETAGEDLVRSLGSIGGLVEGAGEAAPSFEGVYGADVHLEGGEIVPADEAYLRESVLSSEARIVSVYPPIMPSFQARITDEEMEALVGYI